MKYMIFHIKAFGFFNMSIIRNVQKYSHYTILSNVIYGGTTC